MTQRIPQSTTFRAVFWAFLSSDHLTPATGKTIAVTISKNGGAFGNPNAGATNATAIASGWYYVDLDTTDTGTLGPLIVRGAEGTIDDVGFVLQVVSATSGGYTNLDATVSSRASQTSVDTIDDFVDTEVAAILAAVDTEVGAIKTKTDQLTFTTANQVDTQVLSIAANAITAASINASAITSAKFAAGAITATVIATDAIDADALAADAANEIWDVAVDGATTAKQSMRLANSANAGKLSGAGTTNVLIRDLADTKNRINATVDASGNRTAVTLDVS